MNWKDLINNVTGKLSRGFSMTTKPRKYVQKSALINQFLVHLAVATSEELLMLPMLWYSKKKPWIRFLESYVICKEQKVVMTCIYKKNRNGVAPKFIS